MLEGENVRVGQIADVNEIADRGAVGCGVVCTENFNGPAIACADSITSRNYVGFAAVEFTKFSVTSAPAALK